MPDSRIGHYEIIDLLSSTAECEIYRARDKELHRTVALKLIKSESGVPERRLLLAEARAAAGINHPNIATIFEIGEADGQSYIVMEYVEGVTLAELASRGQRPLNEVIDIALQAGEALQAAHTRGIIHCDIKSANILLTSAGSVKLIDFGLARLKLLSSNDNVEGSVTGTPGYLSPEQARGEPLDERTDIFSLGVVIYQLIAGKLPFQGESAVALIRSVINNEPAPLSSCRDDLPLELENIISRALAKPVMERYQSVAEMLAQLRALKALIAPPKPLKTQDTLRLATNAPAAFRGLLPYQEADRARFFGRDAEIAALFERIAHGDIRYIILYGESGCGKTSFLRAGLLSTCWQEGFVPIYCRAYQQPLSAIKEQCWRLAGDCIDYGNTLMTVLRAVAAETGSELVLAFDQFEDLFRCEQSSETDALLEFIAQAIAAVDLPVKIIFSIRSDLLYQINNAFSVHIANPLLSANLYCLANLDEARTAEIIERTAASAQLPFETSLSRKVARDLAVKGSVLASELQIVGERLQNKRIYTLAAYKRWGKEALVEGYLDEIITGSGDREATQLILRALVSDDNLRLRLPLAEIERRVQLGRARVTRLLELLMRARLVATFEGTEPACYELVHEYLIDKINQVTGRVMDATQRANRLLRQHLTAYAVDRHHLIPIAQLWAIRRYAVLKGESREVELLRKSLRRGLLKVSLGTILLAMVSITAAALLSIDEQWQQFALTDGHLAAVRRLAISPDGTQLVSCSEDKNVIVWNLATRQRKATLSAHCDTVKAVAFSPAGNWFATGSDDRSIVIWDSATLRSIFSITDQPGPIYALGVSPDGRLLVAITERGDMLVWRVEKWRKIKHWKNSYDSNRLAFTADSRCIVDSNGVVWDLYTGARVKDRVGPISGVGASSPDGATMISVDGVGNVTFADLRARRIVSRQREHHDTGRAAQFSPDGAWAATAAEHIVLWEAVTQRLVARLEHNAMVWDIVFTPNGRSIVSAHGDGSIIIWDAATRERLTNFNEHAAPVRAVAFSADGRLIASAGDDRSIIVWNSETMRKEVSLAGHDARVIAVVFSPDNDTIYSLDFDGTLISWNWRQQQPRWRHQPPTPSPSHCLALSANGRWLATSREVHETAQGHIVAELNAEMYGVVFSRDQRWLISVRPDQRGEIIVWESDSWQIKEKITLGGSALNNVDISHDGRFLVTGEENGAVRIWQLSPLREVVTVGRHDARVKSVAFSPQGNHIATAGDDRVIALWDLNSRKLVRRIGTQAAPVLALAYAPDGERLAAGTHDRLVNIYHRRQVLWGYRMR